jgi:hypothetical protein
MYSTTARIAVTAMAMMGLFAACGDDGDTTEFPVGVYHQPGSTDTSGTMEFKSDGTFVLTDGTETIVTSGTYSTDGDQFTWETDSYCRTVSAAAESATYTWTQDGDLLKMTVDGQDLCSDRVSLAESGFEKSDS